MRSHEYIAPGLTVLLAAAAAVLASLLLVAVKPEQALQVVLVIIALIGSIIILVLVTFWYAHRVMYKDREGLLGEFNEIQKQIARARALVTDLLRKFGPPEGGSRIMSLEETETLERGCSEAWVVTKDFFWDLDNEVYRENVVLPNIERGVKYTYFFPSTPDMHDRASALWGMIKKHDSVQFVPLDSKYFTLMEHELVIYDPESSRPRGIMVDIERSRAADMANSIDLYLNERNVVPRLVSQLRAFRRSSQQ